MKHTAKRLRNGLYAYRGWTIEDQKPMGGQSWNMTPPDSDDATDAEATLKECKAFIDQCKEKHQ